VSRYLIENDDKDYVFLDYAKSFDKDLVISSLKQLIGSYVIFSEAREEEFMAKLKKVYFYFY